jgi:nicotinate-nucleotide adenylyltransferase
MRVGFLGGSFDPIHLGHLWIASFSREQLALDRVLIVPAACPPHKGETTAPYPFRLETVRRATAGMRGIEVSELEADASRPSYTVESLRSLRADLGTADEIWLLLGGDSLADLPLWYRPDEIIELAHLGIYGREGHGAQAPAGARAVRVDGPVCGLSSTLIRARLRDRKSVRGLVPEAIVESLHAPGPYGAGVSS